MCELSACLIAERQSKPALRPPAVASLDSNILLTWSQVLAARLDADRSLKCRVDQSLAWLFDEGATRSDALVSLLIGLEADGPQALVVDMVEEGLDRATQEALIAHLRHRARSGARALFLMTRSSAILDLATMGPEEAILFCPANHSPPARVTAYPGAPGCEAVALCLASPEVRARTAGTVAWRPPISRRCARQGDHQGDRSGDR